MAACCRPDPRSRWASSAASRRALSSRDRKRVGRSPGLRLGPAGRVRLPEAAFDGVVEDLPQDVENPVRSAGRRKAVLVEPLPHGGGSDLVQPPRPERRQQLSAQRALHAASGRGLAAPKAGLPPRSPDECSEGRHGHRSDPHRLGHALDGRARHRVVEVRVPQRGVGIPVAQQATDHDDRLAAPEREARVRVTQVVEAEVSKAGAGADPPPRPVERLRGDRTRAASGGEDEVGDPGHAVKRAACRRREPHRPRARLAVAKKEVALPVVAPPERSGSRSAGSRSAPEAGLIALRRGALDSASASSRPRRRSSPNVRKRSLRRSG